MKQNNPLRHIRFSFILFALLAIGSIGFLNCGGTDPQGSEKSASTPDSGTTQDTTAGGNDTSNTPDASEPASNPDTPTGGQGGDSAGETTNPPDQVTNPPEQTTNPEPVQEQGGGTPEATTQPDKPVTPPTGDNVFKITVLTLVKDSTKGFDLNGDKKVDNRFGKILSNPALAAFADPQKQLNDQLKTEKLIMLVEITDMTDKTGQSGTCTVNIYKGLKTGTPGTYKIDPASLTTLKTPRVSYKNAKIQNGVVTTGVGNFLLTLGIVPNQPPVDLELKKTIMKLKIDSGLASLSNGEIGGGIPVGTLDRIDSGGLGSILSLLLSFMANDAQPDIDVDGDGLEKIGKSGNTITCTDGDGKTKITAPSPCPNKASKCSCAQNSKMPDGISIYMTFTAARTKWTK